MVETWDVAKSMAMGVGCQLELMGAEAPERNMYLCNPGQERLQSAQLTRLFLPLQRHDFETDGLRIHHWVWHPAVGMSQRAEVVANARKCRMATTSLPLRRPP